MLVLADGTTFDGEVFGASGTAVGEVVFNTAMAGYQEIITDPSYAGQIINFTYPQIGNYGINDEDYERTAPACAGIVVRDLCRNPSNWRSTEDLDSWLMRHGIGGIHSVDTRRLTRHIRDNGSMPGAFGSDDRQTLLDAARSFHMDTTALIRGLPGPSVHPCRSDGPLVVAYDYGVKGMTLKKLGERAKVEVVAHDTPANKVLGRADGVFLSNGPGDPSELAGAIRIIEQLLGKVPIFGICLGHQLLALAAGGSTFKLNCGHHGANHPVMDLASSRSLITSQNHNYAVTEDSIAAGVVSHRSENDYCIEGLDYPELNAFSVQFHPEASPGPHETQHLFDQFFALIGKE